MEPGGRGHLGKVVLVQFCRSTCPVVPEAPQDAELASHQVTPLSCLLCGQSPVVVTGALYLSTGTCFLNNGPHMHIVGPAFCPGPRPTWGETASSVLYQGKPFGLANEKHLKLVSNLAPLSYL